MTSTPIRTAPPADHAPLRPPDPSVPRQIRFALGACAGLTAAAAGLAAAELTTLLDSSLQSPVLDVGDRVVDGVPNSVKTLAIDWFGTNDKQALLIGIAAALILYAVVVGVVGIGRRWVVGVIGIASFGLIGAYASQSTRRGAPWYAVAPSLVGGAVAAITLVLLRKQLIGPDRSGSRGNETLDGLPGPATPSELDRRRFLASAGATAVGAVVVGTAAHEIGTRSGVGAQRAALALPTPDAPLAAAPTGISVPGASPFFTPNPDFYRIDTALTVPQVSIASWRLTVTGSVQRPLTLSYADLLERPLVESDITLTCVSNEVGGKLLGTARWLGIRLDELLAEAGIDPTADQIVGRSVDGYTCGFPVSALDGRDALIAIGMNGEPLPLEHGYPARLIVPGLYGYVSATKWLREIELTRFDRFDQYWVERGWVEQAPIKVQSRIDTPRGLANTPAGQVAIAGVAWAQTRGIARVEVQIDDGDWRETALADELNDVTWRQWSYRWDATPGRHTIRVRATERAESGEDGPIQTAERSEPFPSGATGQHQIVVIVG